jgi:hypothetical protein
MPIPGSPIDKPTLRNLQTQIWLSQPQGYVVGIRNQSERPEKEKRLALEKQLRGLGVQGQAAGKEQGGVEIERTTKCATGQALLLQVGAWARG